MQSEQSTGSTRVPHAGESPQQEGDLALRIERVAIKGLDKLTRRLGLALMLLMGFIGIAIVLPMKGWPLDYTWWVFQLGQTEFFVDTRTIWYQMRWIAPLVVGALASYASIHVLANAGAKRDSLATRISMIGLLVSVAMLALIAVESFGVVDLGSRTSHSWLYPVSLVGISCVMISLAMTRESGARDRNISIIAALVPIALMTVPIFVSSREPSFSDVVLALLLWSGVAYALSGRKLDSIYQHLTFDKLAKWAGISAAFVLVLVGLITNGPRSFFVELRWIGAASAGLVIALLTMQLIRRPNAVNKASTEGGLPWMAAFLGVVASLAVLVASILGLGVPDWLFPASLAGIALAMISLNMLSSGSPWDKALSYCAVAGALIVLGLPLIRQLNVEWTGYVLGVIAVIALLLRFEREPTKSIPIRFFAHRRKVLEALTYAVLVASAVLLGMFVLGKMGVTSAHDSYLLTAIGLGALGMLVAVLTRTTGFWDRIATLGVIGAALFFSAFSGISRWDPALHPGTIASLYIGSAVLLLLSGIRPFAMFGRATVFREKAKLFVQHTWKVTVQVMKNPMGVVGSVILIVFVVLAAFGPQLAPYNVPVGSAAHIGIDKWDKYMLPSEARMPAPAYVIDVVWGLPLAAGIAACAIMLGLGSKSEGKAKSRSPLAGAGLILSVGLLTLVLLDFLKVLRLGTPEWMYPASMAGISLAMLSFYSSHASTVGRKGWVGLGLGAVALGFVASTLLMHSSVLARSQELFITYLGAGTMVIASGVLLRNSLRESAHWMGGPEPRHGRSTLLFGVGLGAVLMVAGIVAYLQGTWTAHWMGTDTFGYDIFSELLYGARTSIIVGIISAIIASVLGALVGLYSGYVGGWTDEVIMRANDVVLSIPWLVLMIIVAAMLRTLDLTGIILIIGLTGWSTTARMVRAQVLSIRERQYIERAKAIGATDLAIIRRHILPNAFPLVFANTILTVAVSILSEATLSFLGMRPVGVVTWGTMLSYASDADAFSIGLQGWIVAPGLCIVVIVLGFTLLGYALDDVLNPKLRKR